jgi:hypothetical protein
MLGENIFELSKKKAENSDNSGSENLPIGFNSFGMAGENRSLPWLARAAGSLCLTSAAIT